jgi:hypothetical protein
MGRCSPLLHLFSHELTPRVQVSMRIS